MNIFPASPLRLAGISRIGGLHRGRIGDTIEAQVPGQNEAAFGQIAQRDAVHRAIAVTRGNIHES